VLGALGTVDSAESLRLNQQSKQKQVQMQEARRDNLGGQETEKEGYFVVN